MDNNEIKSNNLENISNEELMAELDKRRKNIIPKLVDEINSKIKEINSLGVQITDDDNCDFNLKCIVELSSRPGKYCFETDCTD